MLKALWTRRRALAGHAMYWSGVAALFEAATRPTGAIILMYHSVAGDEMAPYIDPPNRLPAADFERQMVFLKRHRHVVPLSALVEQIGAGVAPKAGTVCITFDDGYLDNLTVAAPILARLGLPATLFLATGYVERGQSQWADVVHWALQHRRQHRLVLPSLNIDVVLQSPGDWQRIRERTHLALLMDDFQQRTDLLDEIVRQLQPVGEMARLTMNWSEARELRDRFPLFDIGGHTRNHVDLATHASDLARTEIPACGEDIARELGSGRRHFCYPYGRWNPQSRELVASGGWLSAVSSGNTTRVDVGCSRHSMPRIETPTSMTELRFMTSGAFPGVYSLLGKR